MLIFTRYLYIKDEVEYALVLSLINQNNSCLFWAYELYHSGFQLELFDFLWKTYEEFYAKSNPNFRNYFEKKQQEFTSAFHSQEYKVTTIVNVETFNKLIIVNKIS